MAETTSVDPSETAVVQSADPLLRTVVALIPQLIAYIGADHTYKFANAAYKDYFNVNPETIIGMHPSRVLGPQAWEAVAAHHRAALAGHEQALVSDLRLPGGRQIRIQARFLPHVVKGRVAGFLTVVQDITEQQAARDALQRSELKFRQIAETVNDVFWLSTRGVGKMVYVSPAYERVWERSAQSLYEDPRSFLKAVHPADVPKLMDVVGQYHSKGLAYQLDYRIVRRDGTVRWIKERGYPVIGDLEGEPMMTGVCTDITERKTAELALLESEKRYRAVVEDQTEVISRFKPDGTLVFVSDTYGRFFGQAPAELVGNKWHPVAHHDDIEKVQRRLATMSPDNPVVVIENRVWDGENRLRWMQFINRGFYDPHGRLTEIQSVGRDVTELKEQERLIALKEQELQTKTAELEKLNTALEVILAQRDRQLNKLKARINSNINKMILPDLYDLADRLKHRSNRQAVNLICRNLEELLSADTEQLTSHKYNLTKTELKIATMIKSDMSSNEIATHLNVSLNTVAFHRKNLRKKFGILQSGANLSVYLKHHL